MAVMGVRLVAVVVRIQVPCTFLLWSRQRGEGSPYPTGVQYRLVPMRRHSVARCCIGMRFAARRWPQLIRSRMRPSQVKIVPSGSTCPDARRE